MKSRLSCLLLVIVIAIPLFICGEYSLVVKDKTDCFSTEYTWTAALVGGIYELKPLYYLSTYREIMGSNARPLYFKVLSEDNGYDEIDVIGTEEVFGFAPYSAYVIIDSLHIISALNGWYDAGTNATIHRYIGTWEYSEDYTALTMLDTLRYDSNTIVGSAYMVDIVSIDSSHYVSVCPGADGITNNYGTINTFEIDGLYNITEIDSLNIDPYDAVNVKIKKVNDNVYVVPYVQIIAGVWRGVIKTFWIDEYCEITQIDSLYHSGSTRDMEIATIDSNNYVISYITPLELNKIKTFNVDNEGNIAISDEYTSEAGTRWTRSELIVSGGILIQEISAINDPPYDPYLFAYSLDGGSNIERIGYCLSNTASGSDSPSCLYLSKNDTFFIPYNKYLARIIFKDHMKKLKMVNAEE